MAKDYDEKYVEEMRAYLKENAPEVLQKIDDNLEQRTEQEHNWHLQETEGHFGKTVYQSQVENQEYFELTHPTVNSSGEDLREFRDEYLETTRVQEMNEPQKESFAETFDRNQSLLQESQQLSEEPTQQKDDGQSY